jgi:outer membrane protein OmpA-like peptidoglycan-associated protein
MKHLWLAVLLLTLVASFGVAQQAVQRSPSFSTDGKWSLSFQGGPNLWINDLNTRRLSLGGSLIAKYGLSKRFSIGIMVGYDRLLAIQHPNDPQGNGFTPLAIEYMALKMASADLVVWYNYPITVDFRPYVYVGAGGAVFLRQGRQYNYIPDDKYKVNSTIHIPVGFGFEVPTSPNVSVALDIGARLMDDYTDHWKGHSTLDETKRPGLVDWFPTARASVNFYFGSRDEADDDNDGVTNGEERKYGTNPNNPDSDGDGLKDGEELWRYNTDPLKADTDGDNLTDGDEVRKYNTFPTRPDTDTDGLNDGMEVFKYETDPLRADTDNDALGDGDEVLKHGTYPLKTDTDGDALGDGDELKQYRTDPRNRDTDGGSIDDGTEVKRGTNPLDKSDDVAIKRELKAEVGKPIVLEGIVFKTGSAVISAVSEEILTLALNTLQNHPDMAVEIRGHTDNTGSRSLNDRLSQRRADAVKLWLVNRGIAEARVKAVGYGLDYPVDTNLTSEGRQRNRRIEFYRTR